MNILPPINTARWIGQIEQGYLCSIPLDVRQKLLTGEYALLYQGAKGSYDLITYADGRWQRSNAPRSHTQKIRELTR